MRIGHGFLPGNEDQERAEEDRDKEEPAGENARAGMDEGCRQGHRRHPRPPTSRSAYLLRSAQRDVSAVAVRHNPLPGIGVALDLPAEMLRKLAARARPRPVRVPARPLEPSHPTASFGQRHAHGAVGCGPSRIAGKRSMHQSDGTPLTSVASTTAFGHGRTLRCRPRPDGRQVRDPADSAEFRHRARDPRTPSWRFRNRSCSERTFPGRGRNERAHIGTVGMSECLPHAVAMTLRLPTSPRTQQTSPVGGART